MNDLNTMLHIHPQNYEIATFFWNVNADKYPFSQRLKASMIPYVSNRVEYLDQRLRRHNNFPHTARDGEEL